MPVASGAGRVWGVAAHGYTLVEYPLPPKQVLYTLKCTSGGDLERPHNLQQGFGACAAAQHNAVKLFARNTHLCRDHLHTVLLAFAFPHALAFFVSSPYVFANLGVVGMQACVTIEAIF